MPNLILIGAAGRMGKSVLEHAQKDAELTIAAAIVKKDSSLYGQKVDGYENLFYQTKEDFLKNPSPANVLLDFSLAAGLKDNLDFAKKLNLPFIVASSAHCEENFALIRQESQHLPILLATNTSLMLNVLAHVVEKIGKILPKAHVEIVDLHHQHKKDAPSGTALMLAQKVSDKNAHISSLRGGLSANEHSVIFFNDFERLEVIHRACDRTVLAQGALAAAKFIFAQKPGLYDMNHVLNLN